MYITCTVEIKIDCFFKLKQLDEEGIEGHERNYQILLCYEDF